MNCPFCRSPRRLIIKTSPSDDGLSTEVVQQCLDCYTTSVFHYEFLREVKTKRQDLIESLVKTFQKILHDNDQEAFARFNAKLSEIQDDDKFFRKRGRL